MCKKHNNDYDANGFLLAKRTLHIQLVVISCFGMLFFMQLDDTFLIGELCASVAWVANTERSAKTETESILSFGWMMVPRCLKIGSVIISYCRDSKMNCHDHLHPAFNSLIPAIHAQESFTLLTSTGLIGVFRASSALCVALYAIFTQRRDVARPLHRDNDINPDW
ncbi:hypothetical protein N7528_005729 [Penicillium herquei]|nr:hypothetical protein N7528_005729 [Penicillium herquei]